MQIQGFPAPENAPEPGACIRIEKPEAGLAVVVLDPPHRSLAVLDAPLLRDLELAVTELENTSGLTGIIFAGAEPLKFAAGADVDGIKAITAKQQLHDIVTAVHDLFRRIEQLRPTTVAAVGGAVPGGAFELSLSCDYIVAAEDKRTRIGLPETMLGILPGWGGTHRLPRRIGLPAATQAILTGRLYPARSAKKIGMVDRLTQPERLMQVATAIAMGREKLPIRDRGWKTWLVDRNPLMVSVIMKKARETVMKKTRGNYPAPLRAIDLLRIGGGADHEVAAQREADAIADLATTPICKALIGIFHASEEAKKLGRSKEGFKPRKIQQAGVLGGGVMGAGIASSFADKGVATRLFDLDPAALDAALLDHRAQVEKKRKRKRLQRHEALAASDRLDAAYSLESFRRAEIIGEAVAERMDVKQKVFGDLAGMVAKDCILATNTSSLSVTEIAKPIPHPERVVGMHFFNPVKKMPLVEVILGEQTSEEAALEVAALATRMGKTPVLVKDVAGFLVNRLLGPYLDEAVRLFRAGASPKLLDSTMLDFGMPMGPLRLLDEVGLDIADHASQSLFEAYGARMEPCRDLEQMRNPERLGRKTGRGFYVFPKGKKSRETLAPDLAQYQASRVAAAFDEREIRDRLVLSMVNEAARALEEGVVASAKELDLASVFGMGFAPFYGGLMHYADHLGTRTVVERLERIQSAPDVAERPGGREKFSPAPLLVEMAQAGRKFFEEN